MRNTAIAILALWVFSIHAIGQGTFVMNTATGNKPRITLNRVNVVASDNVWVEVLVEGATSLSGTAAVPFQMTLAGANAGLFSKGQITVGGKPPGTRVNVTIRAWIRSSAGGIYCAVLDKVSTTFSVILGGVPDQNGVAGLPQTIVPAFTGLELSGCLSCPTIHATSIFFPSPALPNGDGRHTLIVGSATPLDLDQSGGVDLMLVRVDYYLPPVLPRPLDLGNYLYSREYLLKPRIRAVDVLNDSGHCSFNSLAIDVQGTKSIPVTFGEASYGRPINAWVSIVNGALADFGYNPAPGSPISLGEKPPGMLTNPNHWFDYEVADLTSVLTERPILFVRHETIRTVDSTTVDTILLGSPGQYLMRPPLYSYRPARLLAGEIVPAVPPGEYAWTPSFLHHAIGLGLTRVEMDSNGTVLQSTPWPGGFVAFREQGITWMQLSAGNIPRRIAGGHSAVMGGQSDYSSRGPVGTNSYEWNTTRDPVDLNGDGTADFMLARTVYLSRNPAAEIVVDLRELALETIPPSTATTISLGRLELTSDGVQRSGSFGSGPTNYLVHFASSAGELAGEVLVIDPFAGTITTRYEPVPQRPLEHGQLPSLNLNIWRRPLAGLRVTWPAEYKSYVLERYRAGESVGWAPVTIAQSGFFDIPAEYNDFGLFRLRQP